MTTPARNVNVIGFANRRSCQTRVKPTSLPQTCTSTSVATSWTRDIRPASNRGGFIGPIRECKAFSHSGGWMRISGDYHWTHRLPSGEVFEKAVTNPWGSGQTPLTPALPGVNLLDRALVAAYNNVKDEKVNVAKFFAEASQTVAMIETRILRFSGAYERFRRLYPADFQRAQRVMRDGLQRRFWCDIPRKWLELQYGLKPLMQDITGGIDHIAQILQKGALVIGEGKAFERLEEVQRVSGTDGWQADVVWQLKQYAQVGLAFQLSSAEILNSSQLGFLDPVGVVWEVRRMSFMVDWLVPIGPWLSALTAPAGLRFVNGYRSQKSRRTFLRSAVVAGPSSGTKIGGEIRPPSYSGKLQNFSRSCYTSPPVPGLYVKSPVSLGHIANALALLASNFQGV